MTKKELVELIIKNFKEKDCNNIDLTNLDFGDMNVCLKKMKARCINNSYQQAVLIKNESQRADTIMNDYQYARMTIGNMTQESEGFIFNDHQQGNVIINRHQDAKYLVNTQSDYFTVNNKSKSREETK